MVSKSKILFIHFGLPIPDMHCEIFIDRARNNVTFMVDHFDSALVITAARTTERDRGQIRLINSATADLRAPARIENL